jgi:hypothetical protein
MNFRQATNELIAGLKLEDLAKVLSVSLQAVRQARATEDSAAYRRPPEGWGRAVAELARKKAKEYQRLADRLSANH